MTFFILGTLLLLVFLVMSTYRTAQILRDLPATLNVLLLPAENIFRGVLIAICVGLAQASELSSAQLGWQVRDPVREVILGGGVGLAFALALPPLTRFAVARFGARVYSPLVVQRVLPRTPREWVLVPLALVPAVLLEELLFRSLWLGGFGAFVPPAALVVIGSALFGVLHLAQGILGVLVAGALGLVFAGLFLLTPGLLAPFVAHYVVNLLQLVWAARDKNFLENLDANASGDF